jgi:hypothetical protein
MVGGELLLRIVNPRYELMSCGLCKMYLAL